MKACHLESCEAKQMCMCRDLLTGVPRSVASVLPVFALRCQFRLLGTSFLLGVLHKLVASVSFVNIPRCCGRRPQFCWASGFGFGFVGFSVPGFPRVRSGLAVAFARLLVSGLGFRSASSPVFQLLVRFHLARYVRLRAVFVVSMPPQS